MIWHEKDQDRVFGGFGRKGCRVGLFLVLSLLFGRTGFGLEPGARDLGLISGSVGYRVRVLEDRISAVLKKAPLTQVLARIAEQSGIRFLLYGQIQEKLTIEFHHLLIDKGLRRLLRNHDFIRGDLANRLGGEAFERGSVLI
jgi:hypothetical protein